MLVRWLAFVLVIVVVEVRARFGAAGVLEYSARRLITFNPLNGLGIVHITCVVPYLHDGMRDTVCKVWRFVITGTQWGHTVGDVE